MKNTLCKAILGTPLFFAGCGSYYDDTAVLERRVADHVEVVASPMPGWHYSLYYGGYVPLYVPFAGYIGPHYYSGGYRAPRTVVNNYVTTHKTTVIRQPTTVASRTTTTTTTRITPTVSSVRKPTVSVPTVTRTAPVIRTSPTPSVRTSTVRSGGFGGTGRTTGSSGT